MSSQKNKQQATCCRAIGIHTLRAGEQCVTIYRIFGGPEINASAFSHDSPSEAVCSASKR